MVVVVSALNAMNSSKRAGALRGLPSALNTPEYLGHGIRLMLNNFTDLSLPELRKELVLPES